MESIENLVAGSAEHLVTCNRGTVRFLIFNRPDKRNAMSVAMRKAFASLLDEAAADESVKTVVVTGVGGNFSAGVDISEPRTRDTPIVRPHPGEAARGFPKPLIAAVDGVCMTGGLELALSCSFIIASDRSRFADTHAKIGFMPGWGQSALLPSAIGVRRARQMAITGEFISAQKACQWGLVNEIVAPELLIPRCLELAAYITACDATSVRLQMGLLSDNAGEPLAAALKAEEDLVQRWMKE